MSLNKYRGHFYLVASAVIYGLFGIFSKNSASFGAFSQGFVRYFILCAFLFSLFLTKRVVWKKIEHKDIKWFLVWILPASIQPVLTFVAFVHLPVGITYFLIYSTMILGGILSGKIFFKEKFSANKAISLLLVLSGLFFIYRSDIALVTSIYVPVALASGLIVGFWNTLTKKVSGNYPELQMILMDGFSTFSVSLIGILVTRETFPPLSNINSWIWIICFAFIGILSSFLLIKGFKEVEAQVGSFILPLELIFASIFGYLFLGEISKLNVYFGGLLILLASIIPAFAPSKNKR